MDWKTPGLHWQYRWAKASIIRSIFCASPGSRKLHRNCLRKAKHHAALGAPHTLRTHSHCYGPLAAHCPSPLMRRGSAPGPLCSPQGLHEVEVRELMQLHEGMQDLDVELIPAGTKPEHEGCMISKSCDCQAALLLPAPLQTLLICWGSPAATPQLKSWAGLHTPVSCKCQP